MQIVQRSVYLAFTRHNNSGGIYTNEALVQYFAPFE